MAGISAPGVGSNLDVNGIVSQLMAVERRPLIQLNQRETSLQSKLSAFGQFKGALSTLKDSVSVLASANRLQTRTASVSDSTALAAAVTGNATPASYVVRVDQLASAHKLASTGFASSANPVGSGTLTIELGMFNTSTGRFEPDPGRTASEVTISPSGNTLADVRDAINAAGAGVTANIINDGFNNGARLVISTNQTGSNSSVRILVDDDDGVDSDGTGLSALAFDPAQLSGQGRNLFEATAAKDALVSIDGISVRSATNSITNALPGLAITLFSGSEGKTTSLTVGRDTAAATKAVEGFVKAYNDFTTLARDLSAADPATRRIGPLAGDGAVRSVTTQIRSIFSQQIGGTETLSKVGITFGADGKLSINSDQLKNAIENRFDDVLRVFASVGQASDSQIRFAGSSNKSSEGQFPVSVQSLSAPGSVVGSNTPELTISQGVNDTVSLTVDGRAVVATLSAGTYNSAESLAAELQSRVNAGLGNGGSSVVVTASAGRVELRSASWGTASTVQIIGGNGATALFGIAPVTTEGRDIAGSINGEAAFGKGQTLTAPPGNSADGLAITVSGGALGLRGTVTFSRGYADRLSRMIDDFLGTEGAVQARVNGISESIRGLDRQQESVQRRLAAIEQRYRAQFTALDGKLGSLNTTSSFLQRFNNQA
jgi:flagellar hook-associated protein 2